MFDVKTYKDGIEKETIRNLSLSQVVSLESLLFRHNIKYVVKEAAQSEQREECNLNESPVIHLGPFVHTPDGKGKCTNCGYEWL